MASVFDSFIHGVSQVEQHALTVGFAGLSIQIREQLHAGVNIAIMSQCPFSSAVIPTGKGMAVASGNGTNGGKADVGNEHRGFNFMIQQFWKRQTVVRADGFFTHESCAVLVKITQTPSVGVLMAVGVKFFKHVIGTHGAVPSNSIKFAHGVILSEYTLII